MGSYCYYYYIEHPGATLPLQKIIEAQGWAFTPPHEHIVNKFVKPLMWAQEGRYGWISKEQISNMYRRKIDSDKQQKGYAKVRPLDLVLHWDDTTPLDPATVKLMRETSQ